MISELQLELTNACNSNCAMCPRDSLRRPIGFISYELAVKIIDSAVVAGVKTIKTQWFGEPLLYLKFLDIVKYSLKKGLKIIITTNGSLLKKGIADKLLSLGVYRINFSIDADNKIDYENIRRGLKFKIVKENLEYLYLRKKELGAKTFIQIDCLKGMGKTDDMEKVFSHCCDRIVYNKLLKDQRGNGVCLHKVDSRLVVGWDGKCYLCCHDWLGDNEIGDLKEQTIYEIWNGEKRAFCLDNLHNLIICKNCG